MIFGCIDHYLYIDLLPSQVKRNLEMRKLINQNEKMLRLLKTQRKREEVESEIEVLAVEAQPERLEWTPYFISRGHALIQPLSTDTQAFRLKTVGGKLNIRLLGVAGIPVEVDTRLVITVTVSHERKGLQGQTETGQIFENDEFVQLDQSFNFGVTKCSAQTITIRVELAPPDLLEDSGKFIRLNSARKMKIKLFLLKYFALYC